MNVVRMLVKNRAKVRIQADDGLSPLHIAALIGNIELVQLLVENGADINFATSNHDLLQSLFEGYPPSMYLFEDKFVTPLCYAVFCGHMDVVEYLIQIGAPVNPDLTSPPILYAAGGGSLPIVEFLINLGADVDVVRNNCYTERKDTFSPIHLCCAMSCAEWSKHSS